MTGCSSCQLFVIKKKFSFIHLNINSIYNKLDDIKKILDLSIYDLIMINESKLDDSIPENFFLHDKNKLFRRDRCRNGGGILMFIRKCYNISKVTNAGEY